MAVVVEMVVAVVSLCIRAPPLYCLSPCVSLTRSSSAPCSAALPSLVSLAFSLHTSLPVGSLACICTSRPPSLRAAVICYAFAASPGTDLDLAGVDEGVVVVPDGGLCLPRGEVANVGEAALAQQLGLRNLAHAAEDLLQPLLRHPLRPGARQGEAGVGL